MWIRQPLLTVAFFVFGSSLALADSGTLMNVPEQRGQDKQQNLETLEARIKALESHINKHLPKLPSGLKEVSNPYASEMVKKMVGWSSTDHLMEARGHQQTMDALKQKVRNLNDRIDRFNRKPYLDTKGLRRASLKRIKGNLVRGIEEATLKTVWHQEQAKQLTVSESAHQNQQQNS